MAVCVDSHFLIPLLLSLLPCLSALVGSPNLLFSFSFPDQPLALPPAPPIYPAGFCSASLPLLSLPPSLPPSSLLSSPSPCQVGHIVARHSAERATSGVLLSLLQLIVVLFVVDLPGLVSTTSNLLFSLPFSRM